jgi:hypothetical protein
MGELQLRLLHFLVLLAFCGHMLFARHVNRVIVAAVDLLGADEARLNRVFKFVERDTFLAI